MATQSDASQTLPSTEGAAATSTALQLLLLLLLLDAFVQRAEQSRGCFSYNNNILCSAVWLFMHLWCCLCEKLYSKPKSGQREREREKESAVQVFARHLTVLFLPASLGA